MGHETPLDNVGARNLPSPPTRLYPSILIEVFDLRPFSSERPRGRLTAARRMREPAWVDRFAVTRAASRLARDSGGTARP